MRLIDADALIVAIEQMMKHQIDADDICEMIQNFPTINPERKKGKWIPCNEKLPVDDDETEDDEIVLVSDGLDYAVAFWRPDSEAWDDPLHGWLDSFGFEVKAWMPLPEPYKVESGEQDETN